MRPSQHRRVGLERVIRLLLVGLSMAWSAAAAAEPRSIDYLYIEANEGGSSGGHVALRFDADTFHFQQAGEGLLRLRRDDAAAFLLRYTLLGNRPIHESRIAVSDDTYDRLRAAFTRRLLVQDAQYEHLEALEADVALVARWPRRAPPEAAGGDFGAAVRAAGYFLPDGFSGDPPAGDRSAALLALRARIAAAYGEDFVPDRVRALRASLAVWTPRAVRDPAAPLARDTYPSFAPTASTTHAEQLEALTALEVLDAAPALRADAYRVAADMPGLDAHERRSLTRFAEELSADLVSLAASPRPDFGYPLLLGLARLAALEASLTSGRLVLLDHFAADAPAAALPEGGQRTAALDALAAWVRPPAERARQEFFVQDHFREADYTELETAWNRWLEVERARQPGTPLRMERGPLLPGRAAMRREDDAAPLDAAIGRGELAAARAAAAAYRARLAELYGYNLISRNCVSEIFATIDAGLAETAPGGSGLDESRRRLGGVVQTRYSFNFIPVVSSAAVERNYTTVGRRTLPSYRQLRLAQLAAEEPAWRVAVRESNTLTATAYHPDPRDSAFLFFTDDAGALRPLLGTANLLVGVADGTLGLLTWPADAGARLRAGWSGALFSLPELAGVNIRKGSMAYVEPDLLSQVAGSGAAAQPVVTAP